MESRVPLNILTSDMALWFWTEMQPGFTHISSERAF